LITDLTPVPETTVAPSIFDKSQGRLNGGEWDGLFSDEVEVDLGVALPGAVGNGRAAYAVAYLLNTTGQSIEVQATLDTPNATRVYVNGVSVAQGAGGQSTFQATVPPFRVAKAMTRVVLKVLERPGDDGFRFSVRLADVLGNPLTDVGGEIIIKLDPQGGI
jgi:hypothetical protein